MIRILKKILKFYQMKEINAMIYIYKINKNKYKINRLKKNCQFNIKIIQKTKILT